MLVSLLTYSSEDSCCIGKQTSETYNVCSYLCDSCNSCIAYCICSDEDTPSNLDRRFLVKRLLDRMFQLWPRFPFAVVEIAGDARRKRLSWTYGNWEIELPDAADTEVQFLIFLFVQNTAVYNK